MKKVLVALIAAGVVGCAQEPVVQAAADVPSCRTVETRLGSHILRRDDCVVQTDEEREKARAEAEALRANQMRRTMPQSKDGK
jgi:type IV pilus biogenesis protein CpaD/CtpE